MLELAAILAIYLAWSVGVNTLGSTLGITIGSGVLNLRKSVLISGFFAFLGAIFLSGRIIDTIGHKLIQIDTAGLLVVLFSAGLLLSIFAFRGIPVFTTYLIMGSVAGYGISQGIHLNILVYEEILVGLFISPIAAITLGFLIYIGIKKVKISKIKSMKGREEFEKKFFIPGLLALIMLSIGLGANSVGVVVGILGNSFKVMTLGLIGSFGMILGLLTWSYKTARTVGISITDLSPSRGFSSHLAAGIVVLTFVLMSIPISVTQTLIGATVGVAIARGRLETQTAKDIALSWVIGIPVSFGLAAILGWFI